VVLGALVTQPKPADLTHQRYPVDPQVDHHILG
jgi:hypothetical protein